MGLFNFKSKSKEPPKDKTDYFQSAGFQKHRENVLSVLGEIHVAKAPKGWAHKGYFSVGGLEYFGFSETSSVLFIASAQGRGLVDMASGKKIARDSSMDYEINEVNLTCDGFDVLQGEKIKLAGKYGGSMLPVSNAHGERIVMVSPLYPCVDLIFQPPFEDCFVRPGCFPNITNENCVRIYRGFLYCYGFSFCGNYFVVADDGGFEYWEREAAK